MRASTLLCSLSIVAFYSVQAFGALPEGQSVVQHLQDNAPEPAAFVANYVEDPPPGGVATLALRVVADGEASARLDLYDLQAGTSETRIYTRTPRADLRPISEAPVWLQWWTGVPVAAILKSANVDVQRVSLAHAKGLVLWVLGASPREPKLPQLWVERDQGHLRGVVEKEGDLSLSAAMLDDYIQDDARVTRFPKILRLRVGEREIVMVNTWLRRGADLKIAPEEFTPAKDR